MGNAILYRMPSGVPGDISRQSASLVDSGIYDNSSSSYAFSAYGLPAKIVGGKLRPLADGDTAALITSFLVRPFPTTGASPSDPLGTAVPPTSGVASHMPRGYMTVVCNNGSPTKRGQVYVRVANPSSGKPVGGIEAASETTFTGGTITGTGTGTIAGSATAAAVAGTYTLTLQSTSNTSKVTVIDPNGHRLADATVGTAYTCAGVTFTITAAGTMTAGDSFSPVVAQNTQAIPRCYFTHAADASGNVEIEYNIGA